MQFVVPPNAGPPPHYHPNIDESFTVLDGAFEIMVGDDVVRCGPGDSVFVPRGVVHTFANIAATPSRFLSISNPGGHEQFFAGIDELIRSGNFDQTEILKLCEEHGVVPVVP